MAALGYFSAKNRRTVKVEVTPYAADHARTPLRRASPVWLRPVQVDDGWVTFTHVFFSRLLPDGAKLEVSKGRLLDPPSPEVLEDQWERWLDGERRRPDTAY